MRVVFDTNVLVSGFLNPYGAPGTLLQLVADGLIVLCYDARVLSEYHEVLLRPAFGLTKDAVEDYMDLIKTKGFPVTPSPLASRLPDPDDEAFLEVAMAGAAKFLVTGNRKHFPDDLCHGMTILSPADFYEVFRKQNS